MAFFKPSSEASSNKTIARLHYLIWALIYAGLLTIILGLFVQRTDDSIGWSMVVLGALVATAGFVLIYVRSKMKTGGLLGSDANFITMQSIAPEGRAKGTMNLDSDPKNPP